MKIYDLNHNLKGVTHFLLAINMKLHVIEDVMNCTMMMHNRTMHIVYPAHLLSKATAYPKNQHKGFLSFDDAPEGYRRGCNYSLHGNLMVLHTMR